MKRKEIFQFLQENPSFSLATSDGTFPHVRMLILHKADESGIFFMVGKFKDVYRQLSVNPYVELCFHKGDFQIRISGQVENLEKDIELKKEILEARPFMAPWVEQYGFKYMAVYRLRCGKATTWSLENELKPKTFIQL